MDTRLPIFERPNVRKALEDSSLVGQTLTLRGWVRTKRENKNVVFINLNDGSTLKNIQIVADPTQHDDELFRKITVGASLAIEGKLVPSQGSGQAVEMEAAKIVLLGESPQDYAIQPKKHSLEFLREKAHMRFRTNTFGAVFRIRHALAFAVHQYFHQHGFFYLHTPIITGSDAEGAGEMFKVTTLPFDNPPRDEEGRIDFREDFFGKPTNLTVSGQLEGELGAMGLGLIYTFGPTFRAENSNTTRHLAEFWMIEPEMAFYDLQDNMELAEDFIRSLVKGVLRHCTEDLAFLDARAAEENNQKPQAERSTMGLLERLQFVAENAFARVTYTEAIEILLNSTPHKKKKFQYPIQWGIDLQSEHERYLVEKHFQKPVIVSDYPKDIKAFYMRQNDDGKTVAAMDVLFPGIGEIIGGSQREERYDKLRERMQAMHIPEEELWWYLETRKYGTVPHSGFGLGFERLVQFVTGMGNIRDVIPFPRYPNGAEF
ncbi:asparagine--tRNA ligase [Eisenibacter elegans]|jgi:asparaginyl-tRNA synthetase|uniref:asparagine--tRNA ligase n=1 Tax=Eisenibacter elegans TaxID=997 RepID=UPI0004140A92|nr:asparagine--tRNA ligase [Eisenibacter elegans]